MKRKGREAKAEFQRVVKLREELGAAKRNQPDNYEPLQSPKLMKEAGVQVLVNFNETFVHFYPTDDYVCAPVGAKRVGSTLRSYPHLSCINHLLTISQLVCYVHRILEFLVPTCKITPPPPPRDLECGVTCTVQLRAKSVV